MDYFNDLFEHYQILTYFLYQNIYQFLFFNYHSINLLFFVLLIILGFITILTPCFISMLPLLFTYIYSNQDHKFNRYLFIVGVMTSVSFLLFLSNFVNLYSFYNSLPLLSSLFLILISLNLMQVVNFTFISSFIYSYIQFINNPNLNLQSYLVGLITGVSSIPCNTSIILLMVFLLKRLDNLSYLYVFIYIIGCLLPLLLITSIKIDYKRFNLISTFWDSFFPLSGSFLLFFSFLILLKSAFL
uniref:Thiol:disulfide interchange protein n=1 Tax=Chondria sp. (in: red algae) TaxID=1982705 RepID=A0A1Z1MR60_9FLOR|nr:thiol:disulfide interchange protein [Chondria sp. (in: red algae)]